MLRTMLAMAANLEEPDDLAAALRRWQREEGLSQRTAALRLGVPLRTYQAWVQRTNVPRGSVVYATILPAITGTGDSDKRAWFNAYILSSPRMVDVLAHSG